MNKDREIAGLKGTIKEQAKEIRELRLLLASMQSIMEDLRQKGIIG